MKHGHDRKPRTPKARDTMFTGTTHPCAVGATGKPKASPRKAVRFTAMDCLVGSAIVRNDDEVRLRNFGAVDAFVRSDPKVTKLLYVKDVAAEGPARTLRDLSGKTGTTQLLSTLDTRAARRRASK